VEGLMRRKRITGLSVALIDRDGVRFSRGYGFADQKAGRKVTPRTVFRIGSITKVFTGTAAMQLREQGRLDIDRPVSEYVPEFVIKTRGHDLKQITARTLMTHHSGLPTDWFAGSWSDDPHAFRQVTDYLRESYLAFPPNTVFSYSNLATALLGVIIERVSGLSYQDYVEQNILAPLGMVDSALSIDRVSPALISQAYSRSKEVEEPTLRDAPAGAILSNGQDMGRFVAMVLAGGEHEGKRVLRPETLAEMLTPQNEAVRLDFDFRIGLNWMLTRPALSDAGRVAWHDGGSPHFFSIVVILPDAGLGAVVLSNSDGGMVNVGLIADEMLKQAQTSKSGRSTATPGAVKVLPDNAPAESPSGVFAAPIGLVVIRESGRGLRAQMQNQEFALTPVGQGWYSLRLLLLGLLPVRLAAVESLRLAVRLIDGRRILGLEQYGIRVPFGAEYKPAPIPTAWSEAAGTYRLATVLQLPPCESLRLVRRGDALLLLMTARKLGRQTLVMQPISETECVILGFGRLGGQTVELLNSAGTRSLKMSGLEFRKTG
jgi:CubicO group peptidase (beta-lactamase class C family)